MLRLQVRFPPFIQIMFVHIDPCSSSIFPQMLCSNMLCSVFLTTMSSSINQYFCFSCIYLSVKLSLIEHDTLYYSMYFRPSKGQAKSTNNTLWKYITLTFEDRACLNNQSVCQMIMQVLHFSFLLKKCWKPNKIIICWPHVRKWVQILINGYISWLVLSSLDLMNCQRNAS